MDNIKRLREQSEKALRLAGSINDAMSRDALTQYACECDEQADRLQQLADDDARRLNPEREE